MYRSWCSSGSAYLWLYIGGLVALLTASSDKQIFRRKVGANIQFSTYVSILFQQYEQYPKGFIDLLTIIDSLCPNNALDDISLSRPDL